MSDDLDIPDSCLAPKHFDDRPDAATVQEIKDFIARTGEPHMWRGHTHTRPEKGTRIEYLEEYDLPESHHSKAKWAPCPCCSPRRPKYHKGGKIGWFPDEGLIRNMGPDCFETFDKEGHARAVAQLRKEQDLAKANHLLLTNMHKAPEAIRVYENALPIVKAVDELRKTLRRELPLVLNAGLWEHIRGGKLKIRKQGFAELQDYATIDGYNMLDPNESQQAHLLKQSIDELRQMDLGLDYRDRIASMSLEERRQTARALGRAINRAKEVLNQIEDIRPFVSTTTIATLRNWGFQDGCPIRIHAMLDGRNLNFGRKEHESRRFEIPPEFFNSIGTPPNFGEDHIAAHDPACT